MIERGERDAKKILQEIRGIIHQEPRARIDYAEIVDTEELNLLSRVEGEALIALAVYIGGVRLIDNILV
jgi:pantoate--beta-alanine ligase